MKMKKDRDKTVVRNHVQEFDNAMHMRGKEKTEWMNRKWKDREAQEADHGGNVKSRTHMGDLQAWW